MEKVSLLIDGELPHAEAREAERHLDLCGDCQTAREDFLLLRRQLAAYPLELDAFAHRRALKRILAAGRGGAKFEMETAAATTPRRRRERFAGRFGMPRLKPAGLAALLLLLFGVAVGVVALMSARRAPVEVASNTPTPAPYGNNNHASLAATPSTPPATPSTPPATPNPSSAAPPNSSPNAPDDLTASAGRPDARERAGRNNRRRAGEATARAAREGEAGGARANAERIETANSRRIETASARRGETASARRIEGAGDGVRGRSSMPANFDRPRVDAPVAESVVGNDVAAVDGDAADDARGEAAARRDREGSAVAAGAAGASKTARHVEQAQLLLRSFRNARPADAGRRASSDLAHEKQRSKKLLYENIVLRREAASRGNLPVESLLDSLEPILIDIANLPDRPAPAAVREINERMRRKNLVAMLQISAVESAAARSY